MIDKRFPMNVVLSSCIFGTLTAKFFRNMGMCDSMTSVRYCYSGTGISDIPTPKPTPKPMSPKTKLKLLTTHQCMASNVTLHS